MQKYTILVMFAVLGLTGWAPGTNGESGGPDRCARCGCHTACAQKTCQLLCDVKKEVKTTWRVECQDVCPLLPGRRDGCDCCQPPPRCGQPKSVKKLIKKENVVEKPVYKCVVQYLCPACAGGGAPPQPPVASARADISPPPIPTPAPRAHP